MAKKRTKGTRPFTTDYGMSKGHVVNQFAAVRCAINYLSRNNQSHATIECPDGTVVDIWWHEYFDVVVKVRPHKKATYRDNVFPIKRVK